MNLEICNDIINEIKENKMEWNKQTMNDIFEFYSKISNHLESSQYFKQNDRKIDKPKKDNNEWFHLKSNDGKNEDVIFCFFYIMKYDIETFLFFKNRNQIIREEKLSLLTSISNNIEKYKSKIKENKHIRININDILNDIASANRITVSIFFALCIIFDFPVIVISGDFYFKTNEYVELYYIVDFNTTRISYEKQKENTISNKYIMGYRLDKPLRSQSFYKTKDLEAILLILNIPLKDSNGKKKNKTTMYDDICEKTK